MVFRIQWERTQQEIVWWERTHRHGPKNSLYICCMYMLPQCHPSLSLISTPSGTKLPQHTHVDPKSLAWIQFLSPGLSIVIVVMSVSLAYCQQASMTQSLMMRTDYRWVFSLYNLCVIAISQWTSLNLKKLSSYLHKYHWVSINFKARGRATFPNICWLVWFQMRCITMQ